MRFHTLRLSCALLAGLVSSLSDAFAATGDDEVKSLADQNRELSKQINAQQKQIDELRARLDLLEPAGTSVQAPSASAETGPLIRLSGEAGLAIFRSGKDGSYPKADFRVDDVKLFVEAPVWQNVYFFGGLDLATREGGQAVQLGELYADAEKVFSAGPDRTLSLRVGRFYTPFGEEYQVRNVVDNPLVTHSLADLWGIDEGVQVYGTLGRLRYNLAAQNGGPKAPGTSDFDKAMTARVSLEAAPRLHLSASAMRTGSLAAANHGLSNLWFANAFFRTLDPAASAASTFAADLFELDARTHWKTGHFLALAGWIAYNDSRLATDDTRHLNYYSLEVQQQLAGDLSGAVRFSAIRAPDGYALAGLGAAGEYFYNPFGPLTIELQRLSVGLNYRFGPPLVWKMEYSRETGQLLGGMKRPDEDVFSTLLGMRF